MASFSVLMSVYARTEADELRQALESICDRQTVKPDEVVVVLDGPVGEDAAVVVEAFRAAHPSTTKVVPLPVNQGLGLALAAGVLASEGDYLVRMDDDDLSIPERLALQRDFALAHPDIDVFGGYIEEFDQVPGDLGRVRVVPLDQAGIARRMRRRNPMSHVSICCKRDRVLAAGNYQDVPGSEDYFLWMRMLAQGCRFANMAQKLVDVRVGHGFVERRNQHSREEGWRTMQDFMVEAGMISRGRALLNMLEIHLFVRCPSLVKAWLYGRVFRRQGKGRTEGAEVG